MKITFKTLAFTVAVILTLICICSCGALKTLPMTEEERCDFLLTEAEKQLDPDKSHYSFDVTVSVDYGKDKYQKKLKFDEYYDATDKSNVKFRLEQSVNELEGITSDHIYIGGVYYQTSEAQKRCFEADSLDAITYFLPLYKVYYDVTGYGFLSCPQPENGKYTVKFTHTSTESKANMYDYLYWAVPEQLYSELYPSQFVDEYTFDTNYRLLQYKTHVDLYPIDSSQDGLISVDFLQTYHYDDFTITAPENTDEFVTLNNYAYISNIANGIDKLCARPRSSFTTEAIYSFSNGPAESLKICNDFECFTQNGKLTFSVENKTDIDGIVSTASSTYDGSSYKTLGDGYKSETPLSQDEAISYINMQKDYFFLWDGVHTVESIEKVSKNNGVTEIECTLFKEIIDFVISDDIYGYFGASTDYDSADLTNTAKIHIDKSGCVTKVEISIHGTVSIEGNKTEINYSYSMELVNTLIK